MTSVLLLGGAGFIGYNIAKKLAAQPQYTITIADNFYRAGGKIDSYVAQLRDEFGVVLISGDFTDPSNFAALDVSYDQVYMLASMVGVDNVNSIPHEIIRVNTALIYNTLEWAKKAKVGRVLFTSTSECYAGTIEAFGYTIPTDESVPLTIQQIGEPRFTYAVTKMLGESGFINYSRAGYFETVIVRFHNVYGPRMGFKHVIPHLAQRFIAQEDPFLIYGYDQTRAFNFISDAVDGTVAAMEKGRDREIYHIGTQEEITIEQLIRAVGEMFDYSGEYVNAPTYPGSVGRRCPDISKARQELGYEPKVGWEEGLKTTIDWYKQYIESGVELHESFYDNKSRPKVESV